MGSTEIKALVHTNFIIGKGSGTAIIGPSGSGKSTLMNILGCLDNPTTGSYYLEDILVSSLSGNELSAIRNRMIGFIFQNFNLLPRYNVFHNIELPLIYSGLSKKERKRKVLSAVEMVGLTDRIGHKPSELSGGERQRVAIARALVNDPSIILADEPTGNLDSKTGNEILNIFEDLITAGNTIIIVTHDTNIAKKMKQRIEISDGRIKSLKGFKRSGVKKK